MIVQKLVVIWVVVLELVVLSGKEFHLLQVRERGCGDPDLDDRHLLELVVIVE